MAVICYRSAENVFSIDGRLFSERLKEIIRSFNISTNVGTGIEPRKSDWIEFCIRKSGKMKNT